MCRLRAATRVKRRLPCPDNAGGHSALVKGRKRTHSPPYAVYRSSCGGVGSGAAAWPRKGTSTRQSHAAALSGTIRLLPPATSCAQNSPPLKATSSHSREATVALARMHCLYDGDNRHFVVCTNVCCGEVRPRGDSFDHCLARGSDARRCHALISVGGSARTRGMRTCRPRDKES